MTCQYNKEHDVNKVGRLVGCDHKSCAKKQCLGQNGQCTKLSKMFTEKKVLSKSKELTLK